MRKLHGYQHETSPIHPNSTSYSTNDTPISRAPRIAEREFPQPTALLQDPPQACFFFLPFFLFFPLFFFLSYFLSFLLLCKMFPLFVHSILNFPWLLNFLYLPILYYKHPIPITPTNHPLPWNPHPHLLHPHHHSPPCSTLDLPFPFLSPRTCPCPCLQPPCPALSLQPNRHHSTPLSAPLPSQ